MDLKPSVPPGPSESNDLGTEAPAQASSSRRVRKLANASLILATFPLFGAAVYAFLPSLVWRLLPHSLPPFFALLFISPVLGLAAIAAGHMAIARGRRVPETGGVPRRALFGTALGYLTIIVPIMLFAYGYFNKWRPSGDLAFCGNNLKRMELVLKKYAGENEMFPPLSSEPGVLMFSPTAIPPESFTEGSPFTCPTIRYAEKGTAAHRAARMQTPPFDDQSYFYLGYAVFDDDDVEAFARAYRKQIAEGGTFDEDLVVEDGEETRVLPRLSHAVLLAMYDGYSAPPYQTPGAAPTGGVPLLIERDLGHLLPDTDDRIRGAYVLYLNSKVYFVERGTWPLTEKTQRILAELAE